jgi:3',5'-cyclic AMP phosphodiesterase CpdA
MIRVLHLSDVHVDLPLWRMPAREFFGKRLLGAGNLILRRGRHFAQARAKLEALGRFAEREGVDVVVCTGDYTALGTESELIAARAAIDPLTHRPRGFVTVPGNHDLYMPDTVADARFDRVFGDLLGSDWPEHAVDGLWPTVRLYDDTLAIVCVNSARPNPQPWRSSGRIPDRQLRALEAVLADERMRGRTVLIATHYAPRLRDGSRDRWNHGLENADELLAACARAPRAAVIHGHIHSRYHVSPQPGLHQFGAGSATHAGREGVWLFEIESGRARAVPGGYAGGDYQLDREPAAAVAF